MFAQTFKDFEVICVDDGSTDGSWDVIKEYGERVKGIRQANAGQSAARNAGAARAKGEYIAFLDQDDRWYPHKLEAQVAVLKAESDVVLVHCNYDCMDAEGRIQQYGVAVAERARALTSPLGCLIGESVILPSAMMIRHDAFDRVGGFDRELRGFEDFDLCARLQRQGRFVFLEESGMCYRVHTGGFSRAGGVDVIRSRERFLRRMQELYAGDETKQTLVKRMLADCYSDWGLKEINRGNSVEARALLWRSWRLNPLKWRTYSRLLRAILPRCHS